MKRCRQCEKLLEDSEFYSQARGRNGLRTECKKCFDRDANVRSRGRRYGLRPYEARAFMDVPCCQSCGDPFGDDATLKFDHCHQGGHMRGVLCHLCNLACAGSASEAMRRLLCCMQYLTRDIERREQARAS